MRVEYDKWSYYPSQICTYSYNAWVVNEHSRQSRSHRDKKKLYSEKAQGDRRPKEKRYIFLDNRIDSIFHRICINNSCRKIKNISNNLVKSRLFVFYTLQE